jgi:hypothetical protein
MKSNKAEVLKLRRVLWNTRKALIPKKDDRKSGQKIPHDKTISQTKTEYTRWLIIAPSLPSMTRVGLQIKDRNNLP